jgi:hypothetical protein
LKVYEPNPTTKTLIQQNNKQKDRKWSNKFDAIPSRIEDILVFRDENISTENVSTSGSDTI